MIRYTLPLALLMLGACSEPSGTDDSEGDFASRVGAGQAPGTAATGAPLVTAAAKGPPPAGANVFAMEQLGDISGVDLGPRGGGCTFSSEGTELLVAAGPVDRALPGKGVVRIGGKLIELDTPPGGIETIMAGTSFSGEGFSLRVQPGTAGRGSITVTDAQGQTKVVAGDYVCG